MPNLCLRHLAPEEPSNWPTALIGPATFTALDPWLHMVHSFYRFPIYRFEAQRERDITALLALAHVQHPVFGNYLTTSPFGSYGGFAYADNESRDLLLTEARSLAAKLKVQYAIVRFDGGDQTPPTGWTQDPIYCTYLLDLFSHPDLLFANFAPGHRNDIRRSLKKGLTIKFGRLDLLDDAYEALAGCMHELGSPYHAKTYLKMMAELLSEALEFAVLYAPDGKLAGAGVFIQHSNVATSLHANILRAYRSDCAGDFLYWKVIEHYSLRGFTIFDLGRSHIGSSNEAFKMKWRPRKRPLAYWYFFQSEAKLPALHQHNPQFAAAIWMWKHLPASIVRPFGPFLIRGLA